MTRHMRTAEIVSYLLSMSFLVACLNWSNTVRHMLADGGADATIDSAAARTWTYGIVAVVALALGLALRLVLRLRATDAWDEG